MKILRNIKIIDMYCRHMPKSCFSRHLEGMYLRVVHNSDFPLGKNKMLGMTLLTQEQGEIVQGSTLEPWKKFKGESGFWKSSRVEPWKKFQGGFPRRRRGEKVPGWNWKSSRVDFRAEGAAKKFQGGFPRQRRGEKIQGGIRENFNTPELFSRKW